MNISTAISKLTRSITVFFGRYHFIIFFTCLMAALMVAILIINVTVISHPDDGYVSQIDKAGFDEETIQRLRNLRSPDEATKRLDVAGRINPF